MNHINTPTTPEVMAASSSKIGPADAKGTVTIPAPETAIRAFERGFETYKGKDFINGKKDVTFNDSPLLPARSRASLRPIFDLEKLRKRVSPIIANQAPDIKDVLEAETELENYIQGHETSFNFDVPEIVVKGSFAAELTSTYTTQVMFTKKQRTAAIGSTQIDGTDVEDLLTQEVLDRLEGVEDNDTALEFYEEYGTHYLTQIGLGALVHVTESVVLNHRTNKRDIEVALGVPGLFEAVGLNGNSIIKIGSSSQVMNFRAVGGDASKAEDLSAYGASAFEKPDIISYEINLLFKLLSKKNRNKSKILEDAYYDLMETYHNILPEYKTISERREGRYELHFQWKSTDLMPGTAEELLLHLWCENEMVGEMVHHRKNAFKWRSKVRRHGSNFAHDWSGVGTFSHHKILNSDSLRLDSDDLLHRLK